MPGRRRQQRSSVTSSWSPADRTRSSSSRRPRCSTGSPGRRRPTCRPRANTWPRCRMAFYVYTVGGRFLSADKNSAAFERFDPQSGNWDEAGGHADSARQLRRHVHRWPDRRRRWRGTDAGTGHGRDVRHRRREMDHTDRRCRRRVTARWSPRSATPCIASAARTGRHMKVPSRRSRPWTSPNACDSPVFESACGADSSRSPAGHFPSALTLREYRCRAAWRG